MERKLNFIDGLIKKYLNKILEINAYEKII